MRKKIVLSCVVFLLLALQAAQAQSASAPGASAQSAEEIVRASRDRIQANSVYTLSTMVKKAKNGSESEMAVKQYSKDGPNGSRVVIEFLSPRSVAGSRFLTMANPGRADDSWIYLPSAEKVRRLGPSDGSKSFMTTNFSNDDISSASRDAALDQHSLLREEALEGNPCYVIQSVPRDNSYQYSKMIQWIDKNNRVCRKVELYDKKNALVKTLEILKLENRDGRLSPIETRMTTHAAGTSTTIRVDTIAYDNNDLVREGHFTQEFLSSGRYQ
jgi:hypothetical protein